MEYFYIVCSLASLVAFIGYIVDRFVLNENRNLTYVLIGCFVVLTVGFWLWFYLAPQNSVRSSIENRLYEIKNYRPFKNAIGESTVEGRFEANGNRGTIFFPSFFEPPKIFLKRPENYSGYSGVEPPEIYKITTDSFSYYYSSSSQNGDWIYRARGKLLEPSDGKP